MIQLDFIQNLSFKILLKTPQRIKNDDLKDFLPSKEFNGLFCMREDKTLTFSESGNHDSPKKTTSFPNTLRHVMKFEITE